MTARHRDVFAGIEIPDDFMIDAEPMVGGTFIHPARGHQSGRSRLGIPPGVRVRFARRLGSAVLPAALGIALAMFALVRMQSANTLWHQELQFSGSVGTGTFGCQPYLIALKSTTVANGDTTYTYTFSGGGISGPECKHNMSYIALPVCFNPDLHSDDDKGLVLSETHPVPGWSYDPDNSSKGGKRVKWAASDSVGHGPFNALEFSFTLEGTGIPTESVTAQYHAGDGKDPKSAGTVLVPHPAICDASKLKTTAPVAPLTTNAVTDDPSPTADDGAKVAETGPTPTPAPTNTPAPTPTAKTVNRPGEYKGILKFPSTPTPGGGGAHDNAGHP